MAATISKTTFFSSGSISFSALRAAFKEVTEGQVSMSELRRDTDLSKTSPIVPDAVENENISTSTDLRLSGFRNAIKRYDIIQTGTDIVSGINPGLGNIRSLNWGGNANRSIVKRFIIQGTMGSTLTGSPALLFDGTGYNYRIILQGSVRATSGAGGTPASPSGKDGGVAMEVVNRNSDPVDFIPASYFRVVVNDGSSVFGGGGGGSRGINGSTGIPGTCFALTQYTTDRLCGGCPGCDPGDTRLQCFDDGGCSCGKGGCRNRFQRAICQRSTPYSVPGAAGGGGGTGGRGQGFQAARQNGFGGDAGSPGGCPNFGGDGGTGETGGNGGDWATNGSTTSRPVDAGLAGRAMTGSRYTIEGNVNTNTVRGAFLPPTGIQLQIAGLSGNS